MKRIVVLSGRIGAGKSVLTQNLRTRYGADVVKSREIIAELEERAKESRDALQAEGDRLDELTGGYWLAEALQRRNFPDDAFVVVDAVRILPQVEAIRERFGRIVTHIHLTAPTEILAERYHARPRKFREFDTYAEASANKTEAQVESLADYCDVLIDTSRSTKDDVLAARQHASDCISFL